MMQLTLLVDEAILTASPYGSMNSNAAIHANETGVCGLTVTRKTHLLNTVKQTAGKKGSAGVGLLAMYRHLNLLPVEQ